MATKPYWLMGCALAGVVTLALARPSEEPRGGVVLNRDPPRAPSHGLVWDLGALPEPEAATVAVTPEQPEHPPAEIAAAAAAADWEPAGDPGVWATPATFSDTN